MSAASDNLTITKGVEDNNVKFDLAKNITVEQVSAGRSSISNDGILLSDGDRITVDGISAGNKRSKYLKNKPEKLISLCETIFRHRDDGCIICLGNSISQFNPYFDFFELKNHHKTDYRSGSWGKI
ncbi:phage DNA encapsidation protein [Bartonella sp. B39]